MRHHPYQCLAARRAHAATGATDLLLAACGSKLYSINSTTGHTIDVWPAETAKDDQQSDSSAEIITATEASEIGEPATKRRKTQKKTAPKTKSPTVANLLVTSTGQHAVATTGEDKSVHVFSLDDQGHIEHLSQRRMAKRPCAIAMSGDAKHILVGDKFGDVYALPLMGVEVAKSSDTTASNGVDVPPRPFKPTATNLTVHSGRNLKALESQMRQAEAAHIKAREKGEMAFEHELLLGHVSMLTDLITLRRAGANGSHRDYILTADRDEHIRVSRGQPQAHVIEYFCFGHTQFVSKLCMATEDALVSGGGDDFLLVWDWLNGTTLTKIDLRDAVNTHLSSTTQSDPVEHITVSAIHAGLRRSNEISIFCACEGIAAIFRFDLTLRGPQPAIKQVTNVITYPHNVLDFVVNPRTQHDAQEDEIVASLDVLRAANAKSPVTTGSDEATRLHGVAGPWTGPEDERGDLIDEEDTTSTLDLFYDREKLRKRAGEED